MDDAELNAIRQARLAELQKGASGVSGGSGFSRGAGAPSGGDSSRASQEEDVRLSQLAQVLTQEARERLSRIRIVRSDRARNVENLILQLARSGQIQKKVTEEELVKLLDQLSQQDNKTNRTKIVYERRQVQDDDDDDFFD